MSNPLLEGWLDAWSRFTGTRRRWRHPQHELYQQLDSETTRFVSRLYAYRGFDIRDAVELLEQQSLNDKLRYQTFKKAKSNGKTRRIDAPNKPLKKTQRQLLRHYLNTARIHPAAVGFRRKKSIADHVWQHTGARIIITSDIEDFFPNTKRARVFDWWRTQFESEQASTLATILTTYHGSLPQGAPTSPALSNVVNYEMDTRLNKRVERSGGIYTRYGDDMVFSWQGNDRPPAGFHEFVKSLVREYGYSLHPQKGWNMYRDVDEPEITGVILRKRGIVTVTDEIKQIMRELERKEPHSQRLAGYRGFRKMIEERKR